MGAHGIRLKFFRGFYQFWGPTAPHHPHVLNFGQGAFCLLTVHGCSITTPSLSACLSLSFPLAFLSVLPMVKQPPTIQKPKCAPTTGRNTGKREGSPSISTQLHIAHTTWGVCTSIRVLYSCRHLRHQSEPSNR
jgi:hypothetical protein